MLQPVVRRTWAPRGHTPIHYSWDRHDRLSVISALTVSPQRHRLGLYFQIHRRNIRTQHVLDFLLQLRRQLGRPILVVLDRWSAHRSAVRQLLERDGEPVHVEWLPSYAPELNPVERVWGHTKHDDLANFIPQDLDDLDDEVERSMCASRGKASLLASFFDWAALALG